MDYIKETTDFLSSYRQEKPSIRVMALYKLFIFLRNNNFSSDDYTASFVDTIQNSIIVDTDKDSIDRFKKILSYYIDNACEIAFSEKTTVKKTKKEAKKEAKPIKKVNDFFDLTPQDIPDKKYDWDFIKKLEAKIENE